MVSDQVAVPASPQQKKSPSVKWINIPIFSQFPWKGVNWSLIVLLILCLGSSTIILNNKRVSLQRALEKATHEKIVLRGRVAEISQAKAAVEEELAQVEITLDSEKKRAEDLQIQLTSARSQQEEVLARMGEQDKLIQELQMKVQEFQISQQEKGKRAAITAENKATPAEPISTAQAQVELEKIIVGERARLQGQIVEVSQDRPRVVVNLGKINNLKQGIILSVLRGGKAIGKVQVEEVLKDMSSARILSKEEGVEFQVADAVNEL